jgi:DNA-binding MarR family transcriptional regulator
MDAAKYSDRLAGVNSPAHLLRVTAKLMTQRAEQQLEGLKLSLTLLITLMLIEFGVAATPGEIACSLGHNAGATTRTIDQLEARGLLTRCRDMGDRRVVTLMLTPEGSHAAREFQRLLADLDRRILAGFTVSEVQILMLLLTRLTAAFETADSAQH